MSNSILEHVNFTVKDPDKTAELLCRLFDWKIRWAGEAINEGRAVHVGMDTFYLALYAPVKTIVVQVDDFLELGGLNHIGVLVDDFEQAASRVIAEGFELRRSADYDPGRRFYFYDHDGIEYEVVNY